MTKGRLLSGPIWRKEGFEGDWLERSPTFNSFPFIRMDVLLRSRLFRVFVDRDEEGGEEVSCP